MNIHNFFLLKSTLERRVGLPHINKRVLLETNLGRNICSRIISQAHIDALPSANETEKRKHISKVSTESVVHIRLTIRDYIIEKKQLTSLDAILLYLQSVPDELQWVCSRAMLHRFMQGNGFIFTAPQNHYECTKERDGIIIVRKDYLF